MEKHITDERMGLKYELVGAYYIFAGDDEPEEEQKPIGIWGQRHLRYLKNYRKVLYTNLLTSGTSILRILIERRRKCLNGLQGRWR